MQQNRSQVSAYGELAGRIDCPAAPPGDGRLKNLQNLPKTCQLPANTHWSGGFGIPSVEHFWTHLRVGGPDHD
jgi:hypothetical protein